VTVDVPAGDIAEAAAALLSDPAVAYVEPDHVAGTDGVTVNDPERDDQWGLDRTGVPAAWDVTRGASEVVVAVVDTGVTVTSELSGRVLAGYNFVGNNTNTTDDNGHGTTVATVIAGTPDNGVAGAGICWYCRILPVKALAANGVGSYSSIARSITWAADHGADIINLSLGGSDASRLLTDAVAYANRKGALVVAAAGNDGSSARHYPAATDGALSVGASTSSDARFPWSNYGSSWVDVAAPGCNVAQQRNGKPAWFCGTSSATPFVSGVAALARSLRPEPSAARIRSLLQATARPLRGGWVAGGRVDAAKALTLAGWSTGVGATPYVRTDQTLTPAFGDGLSVTSVVASVDGVTVATAAAAPWSLAVPTGTLTGPVTVVVTAYDGAVEVVRTARALVVDRTVPSVSFRSPVAAARVGRRMTVAANAVDAVHVAKVELLVRGAVVATDTAAPWSLAWPSSGNGRTTVTLRVTDGAGNTAAVSRTVTLDNVGPSTRIASGPRDGRRGVRGTVRVRVKAADPAGVAKVQLLVDGRVVGTATGPSGTFAVRTAKYGRTMRVKARGYDRLGNVTTSTVRTWRR
jgi:thermitase